MALLEIENLSVSFGSFKAVNNVSVTVEQGDVVGIVGESGSGKSVTMMALMDLIPFPGEISSDKIFFNGHDLASMKASQRRKLCGKDIAMIFQEPMTSLNPCFTIGYQIDEVIKFHLGGRSRERKERATDLLAKVGIPDPAKRLNAYPHQLSGGMNQRIMIAMAIACEPKLLIADEPTTALDVTIQAQILDLLLKLQADNDMALLLITHDMGVVAQTAHRVCVMYAGEMVEQQNVDALFSQPAHPYTHALLKALPERSVDQNRLSTIPGVVPGPYDRPNGCLFNPRCTHAQEQCTVEPPALKNTGSGSVRCFYPIPSPS